MIDRLLENPIQVNVLDRPVRPAELPLGDLEPVGDLLNTVRCQLWNLGVRNEPEPVLLGREDGQILYMSNPSNL